MTDKQPRVYEVDEALRTLGVRDTRTVRDYIRDLESRLAEAEREVRVLREAIAVAREQHPYPLDIFLANVTDYERIVPDPQTRTAISGVVGRIGYDACLARIDRHIAEREEVDR